MKKFSVLLLVVATLFVIVSCSWETMQEEPVSINIQVNKNTPRSLSALLDFSISSLTWKYTAIKADTGLTTGQKTEETPLENKTLTLSQGYWTFTLYGYDSTNHLVAKGSVNKLINWESSSITISVQPLQTTGVKGKIAISLTGENYSVTVKKLGSSESITGATPYEVESGTYVVEIKTTTEGTETSALKYINVYDYLTTTVTGEITT